MPKIQISHVVLITTLCTELHLCINKLLYKTTTPSISLSYVYAYAIPRIPSKLPEQFMSCVTVNQYHELALKPRSI